jgi:stress response protein SCP2
VFAPPLEQEKYKNSAEEAITAAGGGDMLDELKAKAADGIPIGFGKTVGIPDLATKGGECHVGVKYTCKEGKTVDAQFCAIEFNKKGEKLGSALYETSSTPDGAIKYLGDTYGTEGGSEYVSLKLAELADDVQAIVMCIYIWNDCVMDDYAELKLMFKAVAGETILPVCHMVVDERGDHTGVTTFAIFRDGDSWTAKNVVSKGKGPTNDDMVPACQALFKELGVDAVPETPATEEQI